MLIKESNSVKLMKDWDMRNISRMFIKGQCKYNSPNSAEVDAVLLDNQLEKLKNRVRLKMGREVSFNVFLKFEKNLKGN